MNLINLEKHGGLFLDFRKYVGYEQEESEKSNNEVNSEVKNYNSFNEYQNNILKKVSEGLIFNSDKILEKYSYIKNFTQDNWDGEGSLAISRKTWNNTEKVINEIYNSCNICLSDKLVFPGISPGQDGTIFILWEGENYSIMMNIDEDGIFYNLRYDIGMNNGGSYSLKSFINSLSLIG